MRSRVIYVCAVSQRAQHGGTQVPGSSKFRYLHWENPILSRPTLLLTVSHNIPPADIHQFWFEYVGNSVKKGHNFGAFNEQAS